MDEIEDNLPHGMYDKNMEILDYGVRVLTADIEKQGREYVYYETLHVQEIQKELESQEHTAIVVSLTLLVSILIISLLLSRRITKSVTVPIQKLCNETERVAKGDFTSGPKIEAGDELAILTGSFDHMKEEIGRLIEDIRQEQNQRRVMELQLLQEQINPHFLYNTLDSIKWIATMQKNTGIVQVVTALSSLLKNMAKGFNEKVTFRQELEFLQNYVTIEKIRYIELFDVEIQVDEESLYDARIVKLTLQPIVENAIFSGIEPSGRFGLIQIHAFAKDGVFYVTVRDNGVGISPENIQKLLTDTSRITKSNMSGIGLPNVDRRLKLVYGEDYGITIESEMDNYTMITISLPLEYES